MAALPMRSSSANANPLNAPPSCSIIPPKPITYSSSYPPSPLPPPIRPKVPSYHPDSAEFKRALFILADEYDSLHPSREPTFSDRPLLSLLQRLHRPSSNSRLTPDDAVQLFRNLHYRLWLGKVTTIIFAELDFGAFDLAAFDFDAWSSAMENRRRPEPGLCEMAYGVLSQMKCFLTPRSSSDRERVFSFYKPAQYLAATMAERAMELPEYCETRGPLRERRVLRWCAQVQAPEHPIVEYEE